MPLCLFIKAEYEPAKQGPMKSIFKSQAMMSAILSVWAASSPKILLCACYQQNLELNLKPVMVQEVLHISAGFIPDFNTDLHKTHELCYIMWLSYFYQIEILVVQDFF